MPHLITLPKPLSLPIQLMPQICHDVVIIRILNRLLSTAIHEGELDFLENKILHINVEDLGLSIAMSLENEILVATHHITYDMKISGNLHDFLLLISRSEDTDTLFFQRRLKMQGDTELGLYLKNFLDAIDVESLPFYDYTQPALLKGIDLYEYLFKQHIRNPLSI